MSHEQALMSPLLYFKLIFIERKKSKKWVEGSFYTLLFLENSLNDYFCSFPHFWFPHPSGSDGYDQFFNSILRIIMSKERIVLILEIFSTYCPSWNFLLNILLHPLCYLPRFLYEILKLIMFFLIYKLFKDYWNICDYEYRKYK